MKKNYLEYFPNNSFNKALVGFLYPLLCAFKLKKLTSEKEVRVFFHDANLMISPVIQLCRTVQNLILVKIMSLSITEMYR